MLGVGLRGFLELKDAGFRAGLAEVVLTSLDIDFPRSLVLLTDSPISIDLTTRELVLEELSDDLVLL